MATTRSTFVLTGIAAIAAVVAVALRVDRPTTRSAETDRESVDFSLPALENAPTTRVEAVMAYRGGRDLLDAYYGAVLPKRTKRDPDERDQVRLLIVTLPDPHNTALDWMFDAHFAAVRRAFADQKFTLDRFSLPRQSDSVRVASSRVPRSHLHPGVVLFRKDSARSRQLWLVYLVYELPTSGIHRDAFSAAMNERRVMVHARDRRYVVPRAECDTLRIVGPTFSGGAASLAAAIRQSPYPSRALVATGSATGDSVRAHFRDVGVFARTVLADGALDHAINAAAGKMGVDTLREIAWFSEAETAYGAQSPAVARLRYQLPFRLATIREGYDETLASLEDARELPGSGPGGESRLPLDDRGHADVPSLTSQLSVTAIDVAMRNIVRSLEQRRVRMVVVSATDVRDKLVFIRALKRRLPDLRIVIKEGNLLLQRREYRRGLAGALVISTYPIAVDSSAPAWSTFTNDLAHGMRNAVLYATSSGPPESDRFPSYWAGRECPRPFPSAWLSAIGSEREFLIQPICTEGADTVGLVPGATALAIEPDKQYLYALAGVLLWAWASICATMWFRGAAEPRLVPSILFKVRTARSKWSASLCVLSLAGASAALMAHTLGSLWTAVLMVVEGAVLMALVRWLVAEPKESAQEEAPKESVQEEAPQGQSELRSTYLRIAGGAALLCGVLLPLVSLVVTFAMGSDSYYRNFGVIGGGLSVSGLILTVNLVLALRAVWELHAEAVFGREFALEAATWVPKERLTAIDLRRTLGRDLRWMRRCFQDVLPDDPGVLAAFLTIVLGGVLWFERQPSVERIWSDTGGLAFDGFITLALVTTAAIAAMGIIRLISAWHAVERFLDLFLHVPLANHFKELPTEAVQAMRPSLLGAQAAQETGLAFPDREEHGERPDWLVEHSWKWLNTGTAYSNRKNELGAMVDQLASAGYFSATVTAPHVRLARHVAHEIVHVAQVAIQSLRRLALYVTLTTIGSAIMFSAYPILPQAVPRGVFAALALTTVLVLFFVLVRMNRNQVLRAMSQAGEDDATYDTSFILGLLVFAVVPLVAFLATEIPALRGALLYWVEPLLRAVAE